MATDDEEYVFWTLSEMEVIASKLYFDRFGFATGLKPGETKTWATLGMGGDGGFYNLARTQRMAA